MCTAIETIYNNGLNEGIKAMILTCCDLGLSKEDILERIMKNSSVPLDAAKSLVEQYVK